MEASTAKQSASTPAVYLNIASEDDKYEFLKALQPDFLQIADPWNSGLLDYLISRGLISDPDLESMSAKDVNTDRDLRRKVWFLLTRFTVAELKTVVFPKLWQEYHHILPRKFITGKSEDLLGTDDASDKQCLRHNMMRRLRPGIVMDKMYQYGFLDLQQYRAYSVGGCRTKELLAQLFSLQFSQEPHLKVMVEELLEVQRIPVPSDLGAQLTRGVSCRCPQRGHELPETPPSLARRKVVSWVRESPFRQSDRSWDSTGTKSMRSHAISSITSHDQPFEAESSANSATPLAPYAVEDKFPPTRVCFGQGASYTVGKEGGQINAAYDAGSDWPQASVAVGHDITASALAFNAFPALTQFSTPSSIYGTSHVVELAGNRDDPSRVMLHGEELTTSQPQTGGRSFFRKQMTHLQEARMFIDRHCLLIISFMVVWLILDIAMNGFHFFRLFHMKCDPSDRLLALFEELTKNKTAGEMKYL